jgi:hypothetical protein
MRGGDEQFCAVIVSWAPPAAEVPLDVERPQTEAAGSMPTLVSPRLFWIALGTAAFVLVGLIVRLLKKPTA